MADIIEFINNMPGVLSMKAASATQISDAEIQL